MFVLLISPIWWDISFPNWWVWFVLAEYLKECHCLVGNDIGHAAGASLLLQSVTSWCPVELQCWFSQMCQLLPKMQTSCWCCCHLTALSARAEIPALATSPKHSPGSYFLPSMSSLLVKMQLVLWISSLQILTSGSLKWKGILAVICFYSIFIRFILVGGKKKHLVFPYLQ